MLILIIILSVGSVPVEAKQIKDKKSDEEIVQARFVYIDLFQNSLILQIMVNRHFRQFYGQGMLMK